MSKKFLLSEEQITELIHKGYRQAAFDISGISNFKESEIHELADREGCVGESRSKDIAYLFVSKYESNLSPNDEVSLDDALSKALNNFENAKEHYHASHSILEPLISIKIDEFISKNQIEEAKNFLRSLPESPVRMRKIALLETYPGT